MLNEYVFNECDDRYYDDEDVISTPKMMKILDEAFGTADDYVYEYKDIQRNLILLQEGSREAVDYIVRAFHKFTTKYARFICLGHLPYKTNGKTKVVIDSSIGKFVGLYTRKQDKEEHPIKAIRFGVISARIRSMYSKWEYCEIYDEMVIALLNMAYRYKILKPGDKHYTENGTFPMYILRCFHFEAKRRLDTLSSDMLDHCANPVEIVEDFSDEHFDINDHPELLIADEKATIEMEKAFERADISLRTHMAGKLTLKDQTLDSNDDSFLNFNWCNGITCSELFAGLTPMQREILVLHYIRKQPLQLIADNIGCNKATVVVHKKKAIAKIVATADELGIKLY